jgi:hypothetical protein
VLRGINDLILQVNNEIRFVPDLGVQRLLASDAGFF